MPKLSCLRSWQSVCHEDPSVCWHRLAPSLARTIQTVQHLSAELPETKPNHPRVRGSLLHCDNLHRPWKKRINVLICNLLRTDINVQFSTIQLGRPKKSARYCTGTSKIVPSEPHSAGTSKTVPSEPHSAGTSKTVPSEPHAAGTSKTVPSEPHSAGTSKTVPSEPRAAPPSGPATKLKPELPFHVQTSVLH